MLVVVGLPYPLLLYGLYTEAGDSKCLQLNKGPISSAVMEYSSIAK